MNSTLKKWEIKDISSIVKYANNNKIAFNLRDGFPFPYTEADAECYVKDCIEKGDEHGLLRAIAIEGEAAGSIGIFVKDDVYKRSAELGYWLGEPFWGSGIMTKAVKEICTEAFLRFNIIRIFAEPYAHNIGSRRVLEKAGFSLEGIMKSSVCKYDVIYDSCMYSLLK